MISIITLHPTNMEVEHGPKRKIKFLYEQAVFHLTMIVSGRVGVNVLGVSIWLHSSALSTDPPIRPDGSGGIRAATRPRGASAVVRTRRVDPGWNGSLAASCVRN